MPELKLKDIRKDLRWPELRLPEMSRDDIAKALGEARKEMAAVRKDLDEFRRDFEMPKVDVSRGDVEDAANDLSKDARAAAKEARKAGKDMSKVLGKQVEKGRKGALKAAQDAGLVKKPSRIPYVVGGLITLGLVGWALSTPSVKERLRTAAQQARERFDEMRAERMGSDEDPHAFDAAERADVQPSTYDDAIPATSDSPYAKPPSDLPDGMGTEGSTDAASGAATRSTPRAAKTSGTSSTIATPTNGTSTVAGSRTDA